MAGTSFLDALIASLVFRLSLSLVESLNIGVTEHCRGLRDVWTPELAYKVCAVAFVHPPRGRTAALFRFVEVSGPQSVKKLITCPLKWRIVLGMFGWRIPYLRTERLSLETCGNRDIWPA